MILHFQNQINIIMYTIDFKKEVNSNHFIWTKFQ
jgi:hypothetical protein